MRVSIFSSSLEVSRALILHLLDLMNMESESNKIFNIAVSGGSTPAILFDLWANEYKDVTPWKRIRIFWVDERCVPPEDSDSNFGMTHSLMLSAVPIPAENIYRIRGERDPYDEAVCYSRAVKDLVPEKNGWPEFDVVLLGVGEDGHTSSIFPGQEELLSSPNIYETSIHPANGQKRIALTGIPILNARHVIFLITGRNKAEVVEDIYHSGDIGPAAFIAHHANNLELFLDSGAARLLHND